MNKIKTITILLLALSVVACSVNTRAGRIRALETRLTAIEIGELTELRIKKLSDKITRGLNLFSQKINNVYNDQSQHVASLEEAKQELENLKKEIKQLKLNQEKLLKAFLK